MPVPLEKPVQTADIVVENEAGDAQQFGVDISVDAAPSMARFTRIGTLSERAVALTLLVLYGLDGRAFENPIRNVVDGSEMRVTQTTTEV